MPKVLLLASWAASSFVASAVAFFAGALLMIDGNISGRIAQAAPGGLDSEIAVVIDAVTRAAMGDQRSFRFWAVVLVFTAFSPVGKSLAGFIERAGHLLLDALEKDLAHPSEPAGEEPPTPPSEARRFRRSPPPGA